MLRLAVMGVCKTHRDKTPCWTAFTFYEVHFSKFHGKHQIALKIIPALGTGSPPPKVSQHKNYHTQIENLTQNDRRAECLQHACYTAIVSA